MAMLFQDEPDEKSSPDLFQNEGEEGEPFPFQDEKDEPQQSHHPKSGADGFNPFQVEPDEVDQPAAPCPFDMELDEGESDDSAYMADAECDKEDSDHHAVVRLSFSTLNQFLTNHLIAGNTQSPVEPVKKKRRYNNNNRAKAAAAKNDMKLSKRKQRLARNHPET